MGIQLSTNFDLSSQIPLDSRAIVATTGERNALAENNKAYAGLTVYVTGENKYYYYNTNNAWVEFGSSQNLINLVYATGDQTISGNKQFSGVVISPFLTTRLPSIPKSPTFTFLTGAGGTITGTRHGIPFTTSSQDQEALSNFINSQSWVISGRSGFSGPYNLLTPNLINTTGFVDIPIASGNNFIYTFTTFNVDDKLKKIERSGIFALLSGEKVGIGTIVPEEKLHVLGNLKLDGQLRTFQRPIVNGTGVLLQGEGGGGGGVSSIINTTYSTLTGLKAVTGLTPGQLYRISDFRLTWYNQSINDTGVKSGLAPEPLIVLALSGNKISHEAKSEIYPQDTVYYDIDASGSYSWGTLNTNRAIPNFKGWIYRRIDHQLNIDIGWDWRNITVNCCRPVVTGIPIWTGTTNYNQFSVVRGTGINTTGKLYYSIINSNSGQDLINVNSWLPVSNFVEGNTYFSTDENFGFIAYNKNGIFVNLPANTGTRIQQPTFTSSLTGQGTFNLTNCNNIKIEGGYSNVIFGNYFYGNAIGNFFYQNTIGNSFRSNVIGNGFYSNTIGNEFYYNTIGNEFNTNTLGNFFNSNAIGNYFETNTIGNDFSTNTIGNSFSINTIGNSFNDNIIGNDFANNAIGNDFANNAIANNFFVNNIGNDFTTNAIANYFNTNTIGNDFNSNTIGNDFYVNTIGNNFESNTIGNSFFSNTIGNSFFSNTIGNGFYYNTIGNNFRMNTSEDNLSIGNVTGAMHVYSVYNTRLFKNSNQTVRLSYFNASDQLVVTDPTA